jgi:NADPH:quinone reductase-like Zn-dependent oxidoreductase
MQIIELEAPRPDSFRRTEAPEPDLRPNEVRVGMRAASLNFIDLAVARGLYPAASYPIVPVADGAGEVLEVGSDVIGLEVGDRVAIHPKAAWIAGRGSAHQQTAVMRGVSLPGSLAEISVVDAATVVKAPHHLSWEQIAALPICATTAWNALKSASVGPASTVVLLGTGGLSIMALQLAKAAGARVIITSSSDEKLDQAQQLGADATINYRLTPHWDEQVRKLTGGEGADLVLETGGAATFTSSLRAIRQGGTVFTVGFVTGSITEVNLMDIIVKGARVVGNNTGSVADLAEATAIIAAHRISPVIAQTFELDDLDDAYEALAGGGHLGKLALKLDWS